MIRDIAVKSFLRLLIKATGNSRSGIPGNRGPPKFPAGIPENFWNSGGNYGEFIGVLFFFPIFIADYGILVFNLTHCIMCTTHDIGFLLPFEQNLEWRLWPNFLCIEFRYIFKYCYRKITEQRQNFANSDRESWHDDTNERTLRSQVGR